MTLSLSFDISFSTNSKYDTDINLWESWAVYFD